MAPNKARRSNAGYRPAIAYRAEIRYYGIVYACTGPYVRHTRASLVIYAAPLMMLVLAHTDRDTALCHGVTCNNHGEACMSQARSTRDCYYAVDSSLYSLLHVLTVRYERKLKVVL